MTPKRRYFASCRTQEEHCRFYCRICKIQQALTRSNALERSANNADARISPSSILCTSRTALCGFLKALSIVCAGWKELRVVRNKMAAAVPSCSRSSVSGMPNGRKLVGLCRWLRLGPLLDPAIMHVVSMFGCYLRQGHCSLPSVLEGTEESYTKQVFSCWKYWQHQLAPDETRQLVGIGHNADKGHSPGCTIS